MHFGQFWLPSDKNYQKTMNANTCDDELSECYFVLCYQYTFRILEVLVCYTFCFFSYFSLLSADFCLLVFLHILTVSRYMVVIFLDFRIFLLGFDLSIFSSFLCFKRCGIRFDRTACAVRIFKGFIHWCLLLCVKFPSLPLPLAQ